MKRKYNEDITIIDKLLLAQQLNCPSVSNKKPLQQNLSFGLNKRVPHPRNINPYTSVK